MTTSHPTRPGLLASASFAAVLAAASGATAVTTQTQYLIGAEHDTWILDSNTDRSGGTDAFPETGTRAPGNIEDRLLVRFDLSSVVAPGPLQSATLWLRQGGLILDGAFELSAHRLTTAWAQGTTGDPATSGATWDEADAAGPTAWSTAGGDFAATPTSTIDLSNTAFRQSAVAGGLGFFWGWDVSSDVEGFLGGSLTNEGWIILPVTVETTEEKLVTNSTEHSLQTTWPRLELVFLPEPSGLLTLTMLGAALLGRRPCTRR